MSDREFENYLALLTGMLRLRRTQRESISGELRDHLIEHVAQLEASGSTHEEAVRRALEEFGDAAALAANFSALVGMRRRRLIMRCTIGTTVVMTGLVVAMLAFRPEVADDPNVVQAQAESGPRDNIQENGGQKTAAPPARNTDLRTRIALKQPASIEFTETPLGLAIDTLGEQHNVQIYFDKRSIQDLGITMDDPVSLNLEDVPLEMVLDLILREFRLDYRVRNGVILIASEDDVRSQTEVRVYAVPEEDAHALLMLIAETIEPESWRPDPQVRPGANAYVFGGGLGGGAPPQAGGLGDPSGPGSIRAYRGVLVVSQTPEVHEKVEKLLDDLARTGALNPQRRDSPRAAQPAASEFGGSPASGRSFQPAKGPGGYGGSFVPGQPGATPPAAGAPSASVPGVEQPGQPGATVPAPATPSAGTPPGTAAPDHSKNDGH